MQGFRGQIFVRGSRFKFKNLSFYDDSEFFVSFNCIRKTVRNYFYMKSESWDVRLFDLNIIVVYA